jgi:hypothetical protein
MWKGAKPGLVPEFNLCSSPLIHMTTPYCSHSLFTSQVELVEPQAEPTHDHLSSLETELHKYRARTLFVTMRKFLYKISETENDAFPWLLSVAFPPAMNFFHSCKIFNLKKIRK